MADDAAGLLRALEVPAAHVAGFSGGSVIAPQLAPRHSELVRSLVLVSSWHGPSLSPLDAVVLALDGGGGAERAQLPGGVLPLGLHRSRARGRPDEQIIGETLALPHPASTEAIQRTLDPLLVHENADRLQQIAAPALVLAGGQDILRPATVRACRRRRHPNARLEVLPEEAHQPFQEVPDQFNERVDAFWREVRRPRLTPTARPDPRREDRDAPRIRKRDRALLRAGRARRAARARPRRLVDPPEVAAVAPGLARSYRVLAYDRRGHGRSRRGEQGTRRNQEDDLAALIEALDRGPAHIAGTSFGAPIPLGLAARRPELVQSMIADEQPLMSVVADDPKLQPQLAEVRALSRQCSHSPHEATERAGRQFVEQVALGSAPRTAVRYEEDP
jgi:pimeloyl-ACP methyl ester carboxylesterase